MIHEHCGQKLALVPPDGRRLKNESGEWLHVFKCVVCKRFFTQRIRVAKEKDVKRSLAKKVAKLLASDDAMTFGFFSAVIDEMNALGFSIEARQGGIYGTYINIVKWQGKE